MILVMTTQNQSLGFYRSLPVLTSFSDATNISHFVEIPDDWSVVVTDVIGSTKAIEAGAYKNVNTVGVACIAAVTNVDRSVEMPFVFGGDGATFAVPQALAGRVRAALLGAQRLAREGFGLDLRLGIVPAQELRAAGHWVRLAKIRLSSNVTQPALAGRGWETAETWVKDPTVTARYAVIPDPTLGDEAAEADFTGFECRWQGVESFRGHKLAILILAVGSSADGNMRAYEAALAKIHAIYGEVKDFHPLRANSMELMTTPKGLKTEATVRTRGKGIVARWLYTLKAIGANFIGSYLFKHKKDTKAVEWSRYKDDLVDNSDFRKFDGMLRMVIDGDDEQAATLRAYLEAERSAGRLVFGMHKSKQALVTCIIQNYNGNHTHFVDGSDGGYALAARELKAQLQSNARTNEAKAAG
jgi:hypothetical protein